jgi:hypothetical protein
MLRHHSINNGLVIVGNDSLPEINKIADKPSFHFYNINNAAVIG